MLRQCPEITRRYDKADVVACCGDVNADHDAVFVERRSAAHARVQTAGKQDAAAVGLRQHAAVRSGSDRQTEVERVTHCKQRCATRRRITDCKRHTEGAGGTHQREIVNRIHSQQLQCSFTAVCRQVTQLVVIGLFDVTADDMVVRYQLVGVAVDEAGADAGFLAGLAIYDPDLEYGRFVAFEYLLGIERQDRRCTGQCQQAEQRDARRKGAAAAVTQCTDEWRNWMG